MKMVVVDSGSKSPLLLNVKPEDMRVTSEEKRVGNSDYVILFGIALVGLVLGRFPALMLTMTWCLMVTKDCCSTRNIQEASDQIFCFQILDRILDGMVVFW